MDLYRTARPLLFRLDAETAHHLTLKSLKVADRLQLAGWLSAVDRPAQPPESNPIQCMGLTFSNRTGLAAGLDKNGDYIDVLGALGFGFIEIGTVTPRPQSGNPKPRLFRLPEHDAIINRMGFNNRGVDYLVERARLRRYQGVLGINIGKNATTALDNAQDDYLICLEKVYSVADYITVNISSPNTPGLRELQHGELLQNLFQSLKEAQSRLSDQHGFYRPIAIKIAPDLTRENIDDLADAAMRAQIDGIIATNTSFSREGVQDAEHAEEAGGLSGRPINTLSTQVLQHLGTRLAGSIPIIGAGGIEDAHTAQQKFDAGASLVQVYTGLVYQGPQLVSKLIRINS